MLVHFTIHTINGIICHRKEVKNMLEFKKVTFEDYNVINAFYQGYPARQCDRSTAATIMWRNYYDNHYAVFDGTIIFSSNFTGVRQVASTDDLFIPDGMKVYNMQIITSPVRPDIVFRLNIFVAGVTFEDGTVNKVLRSSDFNANGIVSVNFIRPDEASSSICHRMKAYQNNEYIGTRKR